LLNLFLKKPENLFYAVLNVYLARAELQRVFPEVREGKYERLIFWVKDSASVDYDAEKLMEQYCDWFNGQFITGCLSA